MTKKMTYFAIAQLYMKIGLSAFGGWSTTALLLEKSLVEERHLLTKRQLQGAVSSGQLLPGAAQVIIAAQAAYYIRGKRAVAVAMPAYLLPTVTLTIAFSFVYFHFLRSSDFGSHTIGLQAAVGGIILGNAYRVGRMQIHKNWLWLLVALACLIKLILGIPVIVILLMAAFLGLCIVPLLNRDRHA